MAIQLVMYMYHGISPAAVVHVLSQRAVTFSGSGDLGSGRKSLCSLSYTESFTNATYNILECTNYGGH